MSSLIEGEELEHQELQEATRNVLEECRMVLPGIQALFGFQLIAVFNQAFATELSVGERRLHLAALLLSALSVALVMTPAAYHRQVHPESVSKRHLRVSSWLLTVAMLPLMLGTQFDIYIVTRVITGDPGAAAGVAVVIGVVYAMLWVVFPRIERKRHVEHR